MRSLLISVRSFPPLNWTRRFAPALFITIISALLWIAAPVSAQSFEEKSGLKSTGGQAGYAEASQTNSSPASIQERIGQVIGVLLSFLGVLFLGLMIYGGYLWMTSKGNEQDAAKAKRIIEQAIIGLVIVLAAYAITNYIGAALIK